MPGYSAVEGFLNRKVASFLHEFVHDADEIAANLKLGSGAFSVQDRRLKAGALQAVLLDSGSPLIIRSATLKGFKIKIPWSSLFSQSSSIHVDTLDIG